MTFFFKKQCYGPIFVYHKYRQVFSVKNEKNFRHFFGAKIKIHNICPRSGISSTLFRPQDGSRHYGLIVSTWLWPLPRCSASYSRSLATSSGSSTGSTWCPFCEAPFRPKLFRTNFYTRFI
jgi:hypothetical protein